MRYILPTLTACLVVGFTTQANARGFDADMKSSVTGPIKIEVVASEDLAWRADNLPKKLSDRGGTHLSSTFSNNGFYGQRAIDYLLEDVMDELAEDMADADVEVSDTAQYTLRVTLEMAKPNRPTFAQLSHEPGLSYQSYGTGGAEISAEILDASGAVIGTMEYDHYSTFTDRYFKPGTWTDAKLAISRFSKKTVKTLASPAGS